MKSSRTLKLIYWVTTIITVLWMFSGGVGALNNAEFMLDAIKQLGYPDYFHYLLGVAKIIGATFIFLPINRYLRTFAYAGVFFELLASALSYASSGLFLEAFAPLILLVIAGISCYTWFKKNKLSLKANIDLPVKSIKGFRPELVADKKFVRLYTTFKVESKNLINLEQFREAFMKKEERELFLINLKEKKVAVPLWYLAYHHLAQGKLNEQEFLITFCPVCNSGMIFTPVINNTKLDFYVSGVYRGTMIMSDRQTNSYWDHITGECLHGFFAGEKLENMGSHEIIFEKDATDDIQIAVPKLTLWQKLVAKMQNGHTWRKVPEGKFFPGFKASFEFEDNRRPEKELGLGVVHANIAKFYPLPIIKSAKNILDTINGVEICIQFDEEILIPTAIFPKDSIKPTQIFMRWYGFVQTFKEVEIYNNE